MSTSSEGDSSANCPPVYNPRTNIMSLPRELRDQIHEELFASPFRVEDFAFPRPLIPQWGRLPKSLPTCGSIVLHGFHSAFLNGQGVGTSAITVDDIRRTYKHPSFEYAQPSSRKSLAILGTSTLIAEEAQEVLIKKGTLLFLLDSPANLCKYNSLGLFATPPIQNIEIYLDFVAVYCYRLSILDFEAAIQCSLELISKLANPHLAKDTCVIRVYSLRPEMEGLAEAIARLRTFKTVVLKFCVMDRIPESVNVSTPTWMRAYSEMGLTAMLADLDTLVARALGPSEGVNDVDGFHCLTYRPQKT